MMKPAELPSFEATWWPVQMETAPGSGERITVAIVVRAASGQASVRRIVPPATMTAMFGSAGRGMQEIVTMTVTALERQLRAGVPVEGLRMPFEGTALGGDRDCTARDLNEVFEIGVRLGGALGLSQFGAEERIGRDTQQAFDEWAGNIRDQVLIDVQRHGHLQDAFNVPIKLGMRKKPRFGFVHGSYAANFGVLRAGKNSNDLRALKVKLFDLESLRRAQSAVVGAVDVIVGCQDWNADNPLTRAEREQLSDAWEFISSEARQREIGAHRFARAMDAANHLLRVAA